MCKLLSNTSIYDASIRAVNFGAYSAGVFMAIGAQIKTAVGVGL